VAKILADMGMDGVTILLGLLHDLVKDMPLTLDDVEHLFGSEVMKIVAGEMGSYIHRHAYMGGMLGMPNRYIHR
jgi:(p)ppGpp synthase/HD superfamily hydrolase